MIDSFVLFRLRRLFTLLLAMTMLMALPGCNAAQPSDVATPAQSAETAKPTAQRGQEHMLTIYGYNYTNRYIDQFYVEGQGGGNLDVSTPSSGGGGRVCCIVWRDGTPLPQTVRVKWVAGGCMQRGQNMYGEVNERPQHFFKERDIQLTGTVPPMPGYFEVHIYPDDHIEVAITERPSLPRLKLEPTREVKPYPTRCGEDKK